MREQGLIHDWNSPSDGLSHPVSFCDETLRDGLQSPSVRTPAVAQKLRILHLMESLGIESANIGLPGAGALIAAETLELAREILSQNMRIRPYCAARTFIADIRPIVEISHSVGIPITVATFIGTSPIRQFVEGWDLDVILRHSEGAIRYAVESGLPVAFVTEDTTRSKPEILRKLYSEAISWGASSLVLCDTVGHATPSGARRLVQFVRDEIIAPSRAEVSIEWHGHSDRGLGVINAISAFQAGADRLHGCGLGIGERVGNVPMDLLLVNMRLMGYIQKDLSALKDYCMTISEATGVPIHVNYPVMGADAFRTGTGIHAAAVIKALRTGDVEMANLVYSGVPSHWFGLEQLIEIGPMCGRSNILYWLEKHGLAAEDTLVARIFEMAKSSDHVLSEQEIMAAIEEGGK
jgi:isopropylmalate/homocitrate/citramalate synthase